MTEDKKKEERSGALMALKDRETQKLLTRERAIEFQVLAVDMGLDLRLGHLIPMGGEPYITHEGLKYLMQSKDGPGIKDCSFTWEEGTSWDKQRFFSKCIIITDGDRRYEGEGDAIGVPLDKLQEFWDIASAERPKGQKALTPYEIRTRVKASVKAYPLKNVSSHLAMDQAVKRMATTRSFNRAARIALTLALPTVEERYIEEAPGAPTTDGVAVEGDAVVLATDDQVAKIMEFAQSKKEGMPELVHQYSQNHGKPEGWPIDVASDFIDMAIEIAGDDKKEEKADRSTVGPNVQLDV